MSRLRTHLILLVLCAMLPAIGLALYVNFEQRRSGAESIRREAWWASHSAAQESQMIFDTVRVMLSDIAKRPEVRRIEQPATDTLLDLMVKENPMLQTIAIADTEGNCVANALNMPLGFNVSDRPYFQRVMKYRSFQIGEHTFSKTTGKRTIHLAYPLLSADGQTELIIIAALDLNAFRRLHDEHDYLPYGATISLIDRNGIMFYRYPSDDLYLGNPIPEDSWRYMTDVGTSDGEYTAVGVDGQKRIYAFHRLDLTDQKGDIWIRVGIPADIAYRQADAMMFRQIFILISVCIIALYLTHVLGKQLILMPVSHLIHSARKIAEGNFAARADIDDKGEFGQLARSFNEMAEAIYRREEALINAKEFAEAANLAKSRFVATVSHELRTPLNGVIGMTDLALMAENDEHQREYLQNIRSCAISLSDIVNDILDFSKIESGKVELENTEFDLYILVENSVKVISGKCREKHIDLSWHIFPDLPRMFVGDPLRIRQILLNLLGNAVKFTEKGEIAVSVSLSDTGRSEEILPVVFSVKDTGIGISPDKSEIIFESFMQADNSTTRRYGGTGLGLAISKSLVQLMKGNISLKSEPGKGSTFVFEIPLRIVHKPLPMPVQHISGQKTENISGTVLVAEDNSVNMMIITQFISKTGCQVIRAENGLEAYRKFMENKIDLIFMDIHMPEMDGHEATRKIREYENGTRHTPIVAITADAMSGDKEKCLASGMDDYIAKPFKREQVLAAIRRFMADSE